MLLLLLFFCTCLFLFSKSSIANDSMVLNEYISVNKTLVSSGQTFEFGFFSTNNTSKNLYLGVWYKNITPTFIVWVANRNHPLTDVAGSFAIADDGNIVLLDGSEIVIWSSNCQESGNLVLKVQDSASYIWQSFDYPTDTLLPGMNFGWDLKIGLNRYLTSRKNVNDPSAGDYSYGVDLAGLPEFVLRNGSVKQYRSGVWNGVRLGGFQNFRPNEIISYAVVINVHEVYAGYATKGNDPSVITREDQCDNYNYCGVNGICNIAISPLCEFTPISKEQWSWTGGCNRKTTLKCGSDIFVPIEGLKLPDMVNFLMNKSMSLDGCNLECSWNCSCTAYANSDIREGGSGCILWFDDLFDFRQFSDASGSQPLFIRFASSEGEPIFHRTKKKKSRVLMIILLSVGSAVLLFSLVIFLIIWKTRRTDGVLNADKRQKEDLELPLFDLIALETATNNF
ncbi:hypothetical protein MKX01_013421, partial [Papaver californicum]